MKNKRYILHVDKKKKFAYIEELDLTWNEVSMRSVRNKKGMIIGTESESKLAGKIKHIHYFSAKGKDKKKGKREFNKFLNSLKIK